MIFSVVRRSTECGARAASVRTPHGEFETPAFMPVGTQGSVKAVCPEDLAEAGASVVLANTYHLYLRPGHKLIERLGGLHKFMAWPGTILTDSGGFQVYSLSRLRTVSDEGVWFQSHLDGSRHFLGPEKAMEIQQALGADIAMAFDECVPYPSEYRHVLDAVERTTEWARRCLVRKGEHQALFAIVQGGTVPELRKRSAGDLIEMNFDGYALGGLSVGEEPEVRLRVIEHARPYLPDEKPVYLMGVGTPEDIVEAAVLGVDLFDCVMPTRNARNGTLFTPRGKLNIKNARFMEDQRPIDETCSCYTCRRFSRAYLRHLYVARELLAYRLNTIHNIAYYSRLMFQIREAVKQDRLYAFRRRFYEERRQKEGTAYLSKETK